MAKGPQTPAGFQLVAELGRIKRDNHLNTDTIAQVIRKEEYTTRRYIRGENVIGELELEALLKHVGWLPAEDRFKVLMELRSQAKAPVWWSVYQLPDDMNKLVGFESMASKLRVFEASFVFGPLQIPDYARAAMRGNLPLDATEDDVERGLRLRMDRWTRVYDVPNPPELQLLLDESVILRNIGGPLVMADQLEHLASLGPPCEIRILSLDVEAQPGLTGAYSVMHFSKALRRRPAVYVGAQGRNLYLDDEASVASANANFQRSWDLACDPAKSRDMLLNVANEKRKRWTIKQV